MALTEEKNGDQDKQLDGNGNMEPWKIEVNGEKNGDLSSLDKQPNGTF